MPKLLKKDVKAIRSLILNDVLEKVPIDKSYENLCKVIGNDAIAFYNFQYWYYRFLSGKQDLDFDRSSEPEPLQFSDLPVDAVGLIVDKLGMVGRLKLRRVSKPLRDFIEKQDFYCSKIAVSCGKNFIYVSYGNGEVIYAKNKRAMNLFENLRISQISRKASSEKYIQGDDYESEAYNDLAWILKNPKLQIERLDLSQMLPYSGDAVAFKCYNKIKIMLKPLKHQISVKKLTLQPEHPDDVLAILPYVKPGYLEEISIDNPMAIHDWRGADRKVEQIMQLDQWKQAEELHLSNSLHSFPDEVLVQFKKYSIYKRTLDQSQLDRIRMIFATSPVFEHCYLTVHQPSYDFDLNFIGVPGPLTGLCRYVRHYTIPNTDKFLVFKKFSYRDVEIEKKTRDVQ